MKTFVIGDIHGAYRALIQCLERSGFNYATDELFCLGDVCDGWPETNESISELLKIKNLKFVLGNHDFWALLWATKGQKSHIWLSQGGENTVNSYRGQQMPQDHIALLAEAPYYIKEDNRLFVHAGINPDLPLASQDAEVFLWDRALVKEALDSHNHHIDEPLTDFDEVYVGHTPIHNFGYFEPIKTCGIWLMDTGAGWNGTLSMMNIDTKEVFSSDRVETLYPKGTGRRRF